MENKQPTKKEIEEQKKKMREIALKNLKESNLLDLAIVYFANSEDSGYGRVDNDSVDEFLYGPAIGSGAKAYNFESGEEFDLVYNSLLGSRQDGKRYSGQVSEYDIIKTSASIMQNSLGVLKVEDVMSLFESDVKIKDIYKDKYLSDLAESKNKEEQETAQKLIGGYISYITAQGVSKSLEKRAEKIKGGLEKIVMEEDKE